MTEDLANLLTRNTQMESKREAFAEKLNFMELEINQKGLSNVELAREQSTHSLPAC